MFLILRYYIIFVLVLDYLKFECNRNSCIAVIASKECKVTFTFIFFWILLISLFFYEYVDLYYF